MYSFPRPVIDSIIWGTRLPGNPITVYFVPAGESRLVAFGERYTSEGFNAFEKAQTMKALDRLSQVADISFQIVEGASAGAGADLQIVLDTDEAGMEFAGYFNPPGEPYVGGVLNAAVWDRYAGGDLEEGGNGYATLMHELLHGLGLAHPHDTGGRSTILSGVTADLDELGVGDLNQGVFTTMSYNSGYLTGGFGSGPSFALTYGFEVGPMALDIAALQSIYGAVRHNDENSVYRLPDANRSGTFWSAVWDTGGIDQIRYDGRRDAQIDLRPATLLPEQGGGGFVSAAAGIAGGFTIAYGVRIERAIGGSGDDTLIGNHLMNQLVGRLGDDWLMGGDNRDRLEGGNGNDTLEGNAGRDTLVGGQGDDLLKGGSHNDILEGDAGRDRLWGGDADDVLRGHDGNDVLVGGAGRDRMYGGTGADMFVFYDVVDSRPNSSRDLIYDFTSGQDVINLRGIDADWTTPGNQAYRLIGADDFTAAGQVRLVVQGDNVLLMAENTGDGRADFQVLLLATAAPLAGDFIL